MSLIGNRALPLYEAEKLTTGAYSVRFTSPVSLTGLWQITKRNQPELSKEVRLQIDITYVNNYSFWLDISVILKTFPALLHQENMERGG